MATAIKLFGEERWSIYDVSLAKGWDCSNQRSK